MSRPSFRRLKDDAASTSTTASLPPNIERGLASLVEGNERLIFKVLSMLSVGNDHLISSMLSINFKKSKNKTDEDSNGNDNNGENDSDKNNNTQLLVSALSDCIKTNHLSIEAFLTRFFDKSVLSKYCINKLAKNNYNVSGKGNEAILAARIGKIWSKPDFELKEIEIE
jgi:hypothetical protein